MAVKILRPRWPQPRHGLRSATEHRDSVLRKAQAVALLAQLFKDEQRTLAGQFTRPLADRISGYLQCIFRRRGAGAG
jgi:hypothetical protein